MENNQAPQTPEEQIRSMYDDERTQSRIQEHLNNENDVITEQDIANISTGIVHPENKIHPEAEIDDPEIVQADTQEDEILEEKKVRDNEDPEIQTPWNILG